MTTPHNNHAAEQAAREAEQHASMQSARHAGLNQGHGGGAQQPADAAFTSGASDSAAQQAQMMTSELGRKLNILALHNDRMLAGQHLLPAIDYKKIIELAATSDELSKAFQDPQFRAAHPEEYKKFQELGTNMLKHGGPRSPYAIVLKATGIAIRCATSPLFLIGTLLQLAVRAKEGSKLRSMAADLRSIHDGLRDKITPPIEVGKSDPVSVARKNVAEALVRSEAKKVDAAPSASATASSSASAANDSELSTGARATDTAAVTEGGSSSSVREAARPALSSLTCFQQQCRSEVPSLATGSDRISIPA